jgi:hypothetical protein
MNRRDELERLLGGYAAGTLSEAERRELFQAALHDQALFSALADEEALRDALADPVCRGRVLAALGEAEPRPARAWLRRPQIWALAGGLAAAGVVAVVLVDSYPTKRGTVEVAQVSRPAAAPPAQEVERTPRAAPGLPTPPQPAKRPAADEGTRPTAKPAEPVAVAKRRAELPALPSVTPPAETSLAAARVRPAQGVVGGISSAVPAAPPPPPASMADAVAVNAAAEALESESQADARLLFYNAQAPRSRLAPQPAFAAQKAITSGGVKQERKDKETALPPALGLRYALVLPGPAGAFEAPIDTPLRPGEGAKLRVESNERGWLYVLADGRPLFTGPVEPRQPYLVDARPGTLWLILSRVPDRGDVQTLVPRTQNQLTTQNQQLNRQLQQRPPDSAAYAVNASPAPDARVLAEIHLNY